MSEIKFNLPTLIAAILISVVLSVTISYSLISGQPGPEGPPGPQGEVGPTGPKDEQGLKIQRKTFGVNIGFDYGNGTIKWFNDTRIDIGDGIMQATLQVVDADYAIWVGEDYSYFQLTRLDNLQIGEGGTWALWTYIRDEDWPDLRSEKVPNWWVSLGSFSASIPLLDGFTCLWRWTT